jgi:hypothetical protein
MTAETSQARRIDDEESRDERGFRTGLHAVDLRGVLPFCRVVVGVVSKKGG